MAESPPEPAVQLARLQEQVWVLRAQQGDAEAFRRLVDKYERQPFYFIRRFERDAEHALDGRVGRKRWSRVPMRFVVPVPIGLAIPLGFYCAVKALGGEIQIRWNAQRSRLHYYARTAEVQKLEAILKEHPEAVNTPDPATGFSPLYLAARSGKKDSVAYSSHTRQISNSEERMGIRRCLSQYSPRQGVPSLQRITSRQSNSCLIYGADTEARGKDSEFPLSAAVLQFEREDIPELLLSHKADVNAEDVNGSTALHYAARFMDAKVAKLLLDNGADANVKDVNGTTPMRIAASNNQTELVALLLQLKADVNAKDNWGRTPLFEVVTGNGDFPTKRRMVDLLVASGADVNASDSAGKTPLRIAVENRYKEIAELLHQHGAKEERLKPSFWLRAVSAWAGCGGVRGRGRRDTCRAARR